MSETAQEKELRIASEIAVNVARLIYEKASESSCLMRDWDGVEADEPYVPLSRLEEICLSQEPEAKQEPPQDKGIDERAEEFWLKNLSTFDTNDGKELRNHKWAYIQGALSERKAQKVSASQLEEAFNAARAETNPDDCTCCPPCICDCDKELKYETFQDYLKSQATRGEI